MNRYRRITTVLVAILIATPLFAQQPARQPDSTLLTLDTVFTYRPKSLGPIEWQADGEGMAEKLSPAEQPGTHGYLISPRGDLAIHTFSTFNKPPAIDIIRLPQHTNIRTLIDNQELQARLGQLRQCPSEFFRVEIADGVQLDASIIKPANLDPKKPYPALFHVYGEPGAQTVLDTWGSRNQMWHLMLAQQGYIVISVDNRGTPAPRGRAWRKSIYRQMGIRN